LGREHRHPARRLSGVCVQRPLQHLFRPIGLAGAGKQLPEPEQIARGLVLIAGKTAFCRRHGLVELTRFQVDLRRDPLHAIETVWAHESKGLLRFLEAIGAVQQGNELANHRRICRSQPRGLLQPFDGGGHVALKAGDLGEELLDLRPAGPVILGFDKQIFGGGELLALLRREIHRIDFAVSVAETGHFLGLLHAHTQHQARGIGYPCLRTRLSR
jgi:hypothetical protein